MSGSRKDDCARLAVAQHEIADEDLADPTHPPSRFDEVHFIHHVLAGTIRDRISLRTRFGGLDRPVPLYINAMAGGSIRTGRSTATWQSPPMGPSCPKETAPAALLDACGHGLPLFASGDIRHPLDTARALALGAHAVDAPGTSSPPSSPVG